MRSLPLVDASGTLTEGADGEKDPAEAGSLSLRSDPPHIGGGESDHYSAGAGTPAALHKSFRRSTGGSIHPYSCLLPRRLVVNARGVFYA